MSGFNWGCLIIPPLVTYLSYDLVTEDERNQGSHAFDPSKTDLLNPIIFWDTDFSGYLWDIG